MDAVLGVAGDDDELAVQLPVIICCGLVTLRCQ